MSKLSAQVYEKKYAELTAHAKHLAVALTEGPATTLTAIADKSGADGVQAALDVLMDAGHRATLVQALNSPAIPSWIRVRMETFLYGQSKQTPALFRYVH